MKHARKTDTRQTKSNGTNQKHLQNRHRGVARARARRRWSGEGQAQEQAVICKIGCKIVCRRGAMAYCSGPCATLPAKKGSCGPGGGVKAAAANHHKETHHKTRIRKPGAQVRRAKRKRVPGRREQYNTEAPTEGSAEKENTKEMARFTFANVSGRRQGQEELRQYERDCECRMPPP